MPSVVECVELTLTSAHVATGLEQHGRLFVRAHNALLDLWRYREKETEDEDRNKDSPPGWKIITALHWSERCIKLLSFFCYIATCWPTHTHTFTSCDSDLYVNKKCYLACMDMSQKTLSFTRGPSSSDTTVSLIPWSWTGPALCRWDTFWHVASRGNRLRCVHRARTKCLSSCPSRPCTPPETLCCCSETGCGCPPGHWIWKTQQDHK